MIRAGKAKSELVRLAEQRPVAVEICRTQRCLDSIGGIDRLFAAALQATKSSVCGRVDPIELALKRRSVLVHHSL